MGLFEKFKTDGVESGGDVVGGFKPLPTDVYQGKVKLLYFGAAVSGAQFADVTISVEGREHRERIYFTNKAGENTYKDKNTGTEKFLPGFEMINDLCLTITGYGLVDLEDQIEEKVVKIYDYEAKTDVPTNVPCLMPVMGEDTLVAITHQIVDKQSKNSQGEYENNGETREENVITKFFHADSRRTVTEIINEMEEAVFIDKWLEAHQGNTLNRAKGAPNAGKAGKPNASGGGSPKGKSGLFGK